MRGPIQKVVGQNQDANRKLTTDGVWNGAEPGETDGSCQGSWGQLG